MENSRLVCSAAGRRHCNFSDDREQQKICGSVRTRTRYLVFGAHGDSIEEISAKSRNIFAATARKGLHLAVAELPVKFWPGLAAEDGGQP